ncbi:unnamed protein product [Ectocarpus sp. CCAP 1310/34]|nr:unnamed protein product [Ectocarpus sp. CCAP 1310/34]
MPWGNIEVEVENDLDQITYGTRTPRSGKCAWFASDRNRRRKATTHNATRYGEDETPG